MDPAASVDNKFDVQSQHAPAGRELEADESAFFRGDKKAVRVRLDGSLERPPAKMVPIQES
jgi:hypothetical protein